MSRKLLRYLIPSCAAVLMLWVWSSYAQTAVVDWTDTHQVMDGFGGSAANFRAPLPPQMADFFFTTSGIGLSLLRTQVVPSIEDCKSAFESQGAPCLSTPSGATILLGELAVAKQAVARGVTVWSTPWSPPAAMKSNGSFTNGGSLLPANYAAWAASLAAYVKLMNANGVPVYAISVQNEPDIVQNYGSATYTSEQFREFVPYLYSALQTAGVGSTKIMIPESSQWYFDPATSAMNDSGVAPKVAILAAHGYGSRPIVAPKNYGKHIWQTEDSSQSPTYDGSIQDGLYWAVRIHLFLTNADVNAWHAWFLSDGPMYGYGTDNAALTDINLKYPKRAYVIGQWSKFVRPGWFRIGVDYHLGWLDISAFKDPENHAIAIVAINPSSHSVHQTFQLKGVSTSSVTPWITSASLSLASRTPITVTGTSFTYTLPASSVTTFVGTVSQTQ